MMAAFFIFTGAARAAISSSKSYKLHSAVADNGGAAGASSSYNSQNSVGSPLGTSVAIGKAYKIYGGMLASSNMIPDVSVTSFNDGLITVDSTPTLSWAYSDKDGHRQRYYQVQVSKDNFVTLSVDSGLVASGGNDYTTPVLSTTEQSVDYRWRVRVSDGYDYSGWKTATSGFRLSTGAADVPIIWAKTAPAGQDIPAKLWQGCADPYMYWEYPVTGVRIIGYSYAWGDVPDDEADTQSVSYQTPSSLLSDGVRVFNLKAQNSAGNWGDTASFEIWIDRASPVIGGYSPTNSAMISNDRSTISISVTDDHSGVDPESINMTINKGSVNATYDENSKSVIYIPSTPLSEGDNVVSIQVSDVVGNETSPVVWSFVVDTKGPSGYLIINNQDATTNSVYVNLAISASDSTSNVEYMAISNDGVFDTEAWEPYQTKKENWVLTPITGTRKVYAKFRDSAGNESEIVSDTIELIIIAPDTLITSGPSLLTRSRDALFTFKGTVDGCLFRWQFDNEEWSEWSSRDSSAGRKDLADGNHYFKVQAAKDVNNNGVIDLDEMDPVPAERAWTINEKGVPKPEAPAKKPFKFWKEE